MKDKLVLPPLNAEQQRLVEQWRYFAKLVAQRFKKTYHNHPKLRATEFDDLISAAYLGLCYAAQRFDAARGYSFGTYANAWCWKCLQLSIIHSGVISSPRSTFDRMSQENRDAEHRASCIVHLDYSVGYSEGETDGLPLQVEGREPPVDSQAIWQETLDDLEEMLSTVTPRQREFLWQHRVEQQSLKQISERVGLSKERVRQLCNQGILQIRAERNIKTDRNPGIRHYR